MTVSALPTVSLDRGSGVPLYLQIKEILVEEIRRGTDASPAMTEEDLTRRFRVSRSTVRAALRDLVDDGLIYRERSKGTFPVMQVNVERPATLKTGDLIDFLAEQGLEPTSEVRDVRRLVPRAEVGQLLMLEDGEDVLAFRRRVFAKGQPLSLAWICLRSPREFLPTIEELESAGSGIAMLEREYGITVTRTEHHVWARGADTDESEALEVEPGAPVLSMESVMFTREGRPIVWRRLVDRAEAVRHTFTTTMV